MRINVEYVALNIDDYANDAEYFLRKGDLIRAFGAINYARSMQPSNSVFLTVMEMINCSRCLIPFVIWFDFDNQIVYCFNVVEDFLLVFLPIYGLNGLFKFIRNL